VSPKPNFEQFLIDNQVLTPEMLKTAMSDAVSRRISLYHSLVEKGAVEAETLAKALAKFHHVEYQAGPLSIDEALLAQFPLFTLRRFKVLPLAKDSRHVTLATANPGNFLATDEIRRLTKLSVRLVCSTEAAIDTALEMFQNGKPAESKPAAEASPASSPSPPPSNSSTAEHIDQVLVRCIARSASDIHLEPQMSYAIVRERIDGILYEVERLPLDAFSPVLSRLKLLAGMDIVEKRLAQDGRFRYKHPRGHCEIRASTLPTIYGEKMVLRLLRADKSDPSIDMLDIGPERTQLLKNICNLHDGLVLVAGPTGSGKTTTIYAMLNAVDRKSQNLIMIEDPVEYELEMANQVQVNSKLGVTFAGMLPYLLRQDPDILMVGEIREETTTQMVMRAAISGHLVFSSIHAPNAVQTVIRLVDMGVQHHMITSSLQACISQRLLRKLCPHCKKGRPALKADKELLGVPESKSTTIYDEVGCEQCHQLGYRGRFAAIEILRMTDRMREAILQREYKQLDAVAASEGFRTMFHHAAERVLAGDTSIKELVLHCT
jgi:type IV pilus assembly protein PilB